MDKKEFINTANKELIENGNLDVISEVFAADYILHAGDKDYKGRDFINRWAGQIRKAMPDIRIEKVEFFARENDRLVWQRKLTGAQTAEMWGLKASEVSVTWNEMIVSRFEDEKIAEEWVVSELLGQLLLRKN